MTTPNPQWLSAAECAQRTGLTVRALRVYENRALIQPDRSPAGWRRYGARELLQLNQIALLKVLGLTLNQIGELMKKPSAPTLRQLLEMQLNAWKERRTKAERGQAVTEAALHQIRADAPLSVDELCSLIRSIDVMPSPGDADRFEAEKPPKENSALDRYVGHYLRNPALGVSTIIRQGEKLLLEPMGQPPLELEQTGESDFVLPDLDVLLCFEQGADGAAQVLTVWFPGMSIRLRGTDERTASAIKHTIAERIRAGTPMPGSADVLRRMLDGARTGAWDSDVMTPEFALIAREHLAPWQMVGQYFGAIVSMEFVRVSASGWDIFQVQCENDVQRYRIALGDDGKVYGFTEASATAEKRAVF